MARGTSNGRPTQPSATIQKVTPAQAEAWLGRNSHNRPLRSGAVEQLAAAIKRGEWQMNGDAIRFAVDGSLLDGQHRLWAIVESGVTVETLVVHGLPSVAQESMDMGQRRSLKDVLALRGEGNAQRLAAALVYHWRWTNGSVRNLSTKPTIPQALAHLERNPGIRAALGKSEATRERLSMAASMLAAFVYEASSLDEDAADDFLHRLTTGINLDAKSPIYVLRHHLEKQRLTVGRPGRAALLVEHALLIKSWNAYRQGEEVTKLTWRASGTNPEPFPEMV